jgi:hypothetical protein
MEKIIKKALLKLYIVQEISNTERIKNRQTQLGRGYTKAIRVNPYNPLSYIFITAALFVALIMFGVVGICKEVDLRNPFKWD